MQVTEIKVGELVSFVGSEQYRAFHPKPITELRAVSQFHNPDSLPSDTALIVAHEGSQVIAFAGLLPRKTNLPNQRVFSNTCWWADPEKGKGVALPLLLMVMKRCQSMMYVADGTLHTKAILEKTGQFYFGQPTAGIRGFLRFYFSGLLLKKYKRLEPMGGLFRLGDAILNLFFMPRRFYFLRKFGKHGLQIEKINSMDDEAATFIKLRSQDELTEKSPDYFNWVRKYPWVKVGLGEEPYEYPFTHLVEKYELEYFKLKSDGKLVAFVAFSVRDRLAKIPFFYVDQENLDPVVNFIFWQSLKEKYDSLAVFHPVLSDAVRNKQSPFIVKKEEKKITGMAKVLANQYRRKFFLQDGDGDFIFT